MAINNGGGDLGGAGFTIGASFTSTSARDTHFTTNSTAPYDANPFNLIAITVSGTTTYQRRQGGSWINVTGVVQVTGGKGDTGNTGEKGDTGNTGEKGDTGNTGGQGEKGDTGNTGGQGEKGDPGNDGGKGNKGDAGNDGGKGDTGNTGQKGDKGDTPEVRNIELEYLATGTPTTTQFTYTVTSDVGIAIQFAESVKDLLPHSYLGYLNNEYTIALIGQTSNAIRVLQSRLAPSVASSVWTLEFIETPIRTNTTAFIASEKVTVIFEVGAVITQSKIYPHIKNILTPGTNFQTTADDTAETFELSSVLKRSWTQVDTQDELDDITVIGVVAFALVQEDFGDYEVGDVLFYDGIQWIEFIDQSELSRGIRGFKGRPAVNRTITRAVTTGDTPTETQVVINSDNIIINVNAADVNKNRIEELPEQTPIYIQISNGTVFRQFGVSSVDVDDDYAQINFESVEHAQGTFDTTHSVTISFGDYKDGDGTGDTTTTTTTTVSYPAGGDTGQVLAKASNSDDDVEWTDQESASATDLSIGTRDGNSIEIESSTGTNVEIAAATSSNAGLMTNDDKTKLNNIEIAAEVNVQVDWDSSSGDTQILNKPGDVTTTTPGFMTAADKTKLDGITSTELIPSGGTDGQVLAKSSADDYAVEWTDVSQSGDGITNLSIANRDGDSLDIASSTGTDATILSASATDAGLMSAADKAKMTAIETSATADQTGAEIKTAYEAESDTNAFTDALKTKLDAIAAGAESNVQSDWNQATNTADDFIKNKPATISTAQVLKLTGIETGATADQTGAEIKTAYESESDTNAFTDTLKTKLDGIATGATATGDANVQADWDITDSSSDAFIKNQPTIITAAQTTKLAGIATAAEVNVQPDWSQATTTADDFIKNKPTIITAAQTTKLSGIATGAEVNVQSDWDQTTDTVDDFIKNKPTAQLVPDGGTSGQILSKDSADDYDVTWVSASAVGGDTDLSIANRGTTTLQIASSNGDNATVPAATTALSGLMASVDKTKLDGIATGAQVNVVTDLGADNRDSDSIDITSSTGDDVTVPSATTSLAGLMSGPDKTKLNAIPMGAEANVDTDLGIGDRTTHTVEIESSTGDDVTFPAATTSLAGLMSSTDKTKLDALPVTSEMNVQSDWTQTTTTDDSYIKNKPGAATTSTAGFMSGADKTKLDALATNRQIPSGGDDGQVLAKSSGTDYVVEWTDVATGSGATNLGSDSRDTDSLDITSSTGTDVTVPSATETLAGLMSRDDKVKLNGIATGAEVNVQSNWTATSGDAQILNKPTTISTAQATKLGGIATGAEVNVQADWTQATAGADDYIKNKPTTITSTQTSKLSGIATGAEANVDTDLSVGTRTTHTLNVDSSTGDNVTLPSVTASGAGLMNSTDKTKLDGIATGAEVNVQSNWAATTGDAQILNKPTTISTAQATKLAGIETAAEVNVQADWTQATAGSDDFIKNKPTTQLIPSGGTDGQVLSKSSGTDYAIEWADAATGSGATNLSLDDRDSDSIDIVSSSGTNVTLPSVTTSLAGLMASADKTKLNGIATGAEVNVDTDLSVGTKTTHTVEIESSTGDDVTLPTATTSLAGVMSSTDKTKLDGIATGAEVNVQVDWSESTSGDDAFIKNKPTTITAAQTTKLSGIETGAEVNVQVDWSESTSTADDYIKNKPGAATTSAAGFMSSADKTKLNSLATNRLIPSGGTDGQVLAKSSGTDYAVEWVDDTTTSGTGSTNLGSDNRDSDSIDITSSSGTDVTVPSATTSLAGLMSGPDKTKLSGIATGANINVKSNWAESDTEADAYIRNKPATGLFIPTGGASDQILAKASGTNYDTEWIDAPSGGGGGSGTTNLSIANRDVDSLDIASSTGTDATIPSASTTAAGLMSKDDKVKLNSINTDTIQSDWDQTDNTSDDFIKNKPGTLTASQVGTASNNMVGLVSGSLLAHAVDTHGGSLTGTPGNLNQRVESVTFDAYTTTIGGQSIGNFLTPKDTDPIQNVFGGGATEMISVSDRVVNQTSGGRYFTIAKAGVYGMSWYGKLDISQGQPTPHLDVIQQGELFGVGQPVLGSTTVEYIPYTAADQYFFTNGIFFVPADGAEVRFRVSNSNTTLGIGNEPRFTVDADSVFKMFRLSDQTVTDLAIDDHGVSTLDITSSTGTDITIPASTTTATGLMSSEDKTKLDGISANELIPSGGTDTQVLAKSSDTDYEVEWVDAATGGGGGSGTTNLSVINRDSDSLDIASSSGDNATIASATTSLAGLMGSADKTKLNGIATGAEVNVGTNLGNTRHANYYIVISSTGTNSMIPAADTSFAGVLTAADKTKLDGIATGAEVNVQSDWDVNNTGSDAHIRNKPTTITSAQTTKLSGIETGAEVNVATNLSSIRATSSVTITSSTGTNIGIGAATTGLAGVMSSGDKTKLDGITADELIPSGGTDTQVLAKSSDTDYEVEWVDAASGGATTVTDITLARTATSIQIRPNTGLVSGIAATIPGPTAALAGIMIATDKTKLDTLATNRQIPSGGDDTQILAKSSDSDYDTQWTTVGKSGIIFDSVTGAPTTGTADTYTITITDTSITSYSVNDRYTFQLPSEMAAGANVQLRLNSLTATDVLASDGVTQLNTDDLVRGKLITITLISTTTFVSDITVGRRRTAILDEQDVDLTATNPVAFNLSEDLTGLTNVDFQVILVHDTRTTMSSRIPVETLLEKTVITATQTNANNMIKIHVGRIIEPSLSGWGDITLNMGRFTNSRIGLRSSHDIDDIQIHLIRYN